MTGRRPGAAYVLNAILALAAAGCAAGGQAAEGDKATVVHVVDGDTFEVRFGDGTVERVRSPQIDTPEIDECGYDASSAALQELVLGENVELLPTEHGPDRDPYDRLLRAAEVDGGDVGRQLVRDGLARWVPWYADEDPRLAAMYETAEQRARDEGAGFWSSCGWK